MSLDQKALESLSGPQQIIVMKSLTQEAAAWLLGVTSRTLRHHSGKITRHADDSYDARAVVSSGLLKAEPPELSPDEQESCIRAAEFLTGDYCVVSPAVMRLIRELEEKHGDRGLAEFVKLVRETWIEDYQATDRDPPLPSEAELRRQIEEQVETTLRSRLKWNADARLKRGVECESCGKVRRGRQWVTAKAKADEHCLLGTCPSCHDLQQQQRTRRKKRRNLESLSVDLMADEE